MKGRLIKYFLGYSLIILYGLNTTAQVPQGNGSTHEKWEFALEDTGDVLQVAMPAIAGLTTIIKKRLARDKTICTFLWNKFNYYPFTQTNHKKRKA
ncbi:hypothetical protein [Tamlana flava]|uniref:hypothetical protein n=1 Tax=Tamlana flava TaxID=3158572 RepID=UPI00351B825C